ncbi:MAG: hypothetical protein CSA03_02035 [Bacteroidetes bacterium]|nr:MAG: hypothetical protein CSA03_02035 [Bacteroidota bacterium]
MKYSNANFSGTFRLKYTKVLCLKSIFIFLIASCGYSNAPQHDEGRPVFVNDQIERLLPVSVGAEQTTNYLPMLEGKKVGIVGNQSSLIGETHLVDSLLSLNIDVIKVFSPEHGFRGDADAGEHVSSERDQKTGLPIVSLYGKNKKPTQDQLKGLDIVVFDIQDVGVRFYTYISTLHYVMEACAEANIPVIVLDRPNPNGHYVDGPVLDMKYTSFVGMHPVPIVYGMTIGEYGKMINGEGWLENDLNCDLTVIPCKNYDHNTPYSLPVPPSPNLRSDVSIQLYPSLCLLEATTVSVGRGTDGPFERYGHPDFPEMDFSFTPKSGPGSKNPKHEGEKCYGYNMGDQEDRRETRFELNFLLNSNKLLKGKTFVDRTRMFNLLAGNDVLIQQLENGASEEEIRASWQEKLDAFRLIREKYLVYE